MSYVDQGGARLHQGPALPERQRLVGTAGFLTEVEQMVSLMEQRRHRIVADAEGDLGEVQQHVEWIAENLQAMRADREIQDEKRLRDERSFEGRAHDMIGSLREARQDSDLKLEELWSYELHELGKLQSSFQNKQGDAMTRQADQQVKSLATELEEQRRQRMASGERLLAELDDHFHRVHEQIVAQGKLRFQTEATAMQMAEKVRSDMVTMLEHERTQREAVQGKLLNLLEEACGRIEGSLHAPSMLDGGAARRQLLAAAARPLRATEPLAAQPQAAPSMLL